MKLFPYSEYELSYRIDAEHAMRALDGHTKTGLNLEFYLNSVSRQPPGSKNSRKTAAAGTVHLHRDTLSAMDRRKWLDEGWGN